MIPLSESVLQRFCGSAAGWGLLTEEELVEIASLPDRGTHALPPTAVWLHHGLRREQLRVGFCEGGLT